ncbi:MAG: hypothetical protein AAFP90_04985, partial [Planctomycetota bacterium]
MAAAAVFFVVGCPSQPSTPNGGGEKNANGTNGAQSQSSTRATKTALSIAQLQSQIDRAAQVGRWDRAETLVRQLLEKRTDATTLGIAIQISQQRGDVVTTDQRFQQYDQQFGPLPDAALIQWVRPACAAGNLVRMTERLQRDLDPLLATDPRRGDPELHRLLSYLTCTLGDMQAARRQYAILSELDAVQPSELLPLASNYYRPKRDEQLIEIATKRFPEESLLLFSQAVDHWLKDRAPQSLQVTKKILRQHPKNKPVVALAALLLDKLDQHDDLQQLLADTYDLQIAHPMYCYA